MRKIIVLTFTFCTYLNFAHSQGCIAVRNISGFGQYNLTDNAFSTSEWQINVNNRYFKAYHDYKEKVDQKTPKANQSIVKSYSIDIAITRLLKNGWSLDLSLPFAANTRTTSLEHGGPNTTRHSTHSFGIGDIRFTAYKWLLKPTVSQKGNIQVGLGIKLPTGDYKYQDYFYRNDTTKILSAVNPSIQLGDGGTGIVTELNGFYIVSHNISLYGNLYYMINPRDLSGILFTAGRTPTALQIRAGAVELSVPDVYAIRAGANFNFGQWAFSAGIRDEGIPVHDLLGQSNGVRRAGYNLSAEPGLLYKMKKVTLYSYVPFIVSRAIKQNVPDKNLTELTGVYTVGAGGSGDYQLFVGAVFKL
jgi:hypothetical protein